MHSLLRLTLASLTLILLTGLPGLRADEAEDDAEAEALVGKPAPDLEGDFAINGKPTRLSNLKGKVVLLDFWAVWCGPCVATFPHLREWNNEYKEDGLVILGVTSYYKRFGFDRQKGQLKQVGKAEKDEETGKMKIQGGLSPEEEREMLKGFAEHHKLEHRLMALPREAWDKAGKDYKLMGIPTMVLIDRKGIVRMVKVGSDQKNVEAIEAGIKKLLKKS